MNEPNTKTRQVAIQTSIALVNDTAGIPRMCTELCVVMLLTGARSRHAPRAAAAPSQLCVVIVSIVRMPRLMRAGTDSRSIQNDTHDNSTTSRLGRNVERM